VPADTATVIFGHHVRPITHPGTAPTEVTEFTANDNWEDIPTAIDALDGALGLSRPGAARLLVIISDGHFRDIPRHDAQQRLDRLRTTGCGVLWLTTDATDTPGRCHRAPDNRPCRHRTDHRTRRHHRPARHPLTPTRRGWPPAR
jgi:hypothetical protein